MKHLMLLAFFMVLTIGLANADSISIESVKIEPKEVEPGNLTKISIRLLNEGSKDIKNIKVALDLSSVELPFAPIDSASQKIIDEIERDEMEEVSFMIKASSDAQPRIYKIPIIINYKEDEVIITETSVIGLDVQSTPILEVAIEESEIFKLNQQGEITIRFVNKGLSDIKFLSVKVNKNANYDILSSNSFYVGNIEPDDFETVNFRLNFKNKVGSLPISIEYRDNNNKLYKKNYNLPLNLYTQEEAYRLGLENKSNPLIYVVAAVIIVAIILIFRRRRKIKKLSK